MLGNIVVVSNVDKLFLSIQTLLRTEYCNTCGVLNYRKIHQSKYNQLCTDTNDKIKMRMGALVGPLQRLRPSRLDIAIAMKIALIRLLSNKKMAIFEFYLG